MGDFKMNHGEKFKYCVIQFLQLPYKGINEYICVPWSWIVLRRKMDQKVIVSYPVENPLDTVKRVKEWQKRSDDWKLYLSVVKYCTNLYDDAEIFINGKMNDVHNEYKCSNLKNRVQELSASVKKKTRKPKRKSKSNHEIKKPLDIDVTSKNNDKSQTKRLKRTTLPTPDTEAAVKRTRKKRTEFKYYVIQFLELPYKGIDEYICVPWTWIVCRRQIDQKVIVSYPVENPLDTVKRVKRRQKRSDDWKLYMSVVEYCTDLYDDAEIFINGKMNDVHNEYKCSNLKNRVQELSAPVKKKTRKSKRKSKSNHEIKKPLDLDVTSKNNDKSQTKRLKRTTLPTPDTEAAVKRTNVIEPTKSVSDAAEQPSLAFECSSENQPLSTREDFPMQNSCLSEISVEESDDRSYVEGIDHAENVTQTQTSVNQNFSNSTNSMSNPELTIDPTFFKELFAVLRDLHTVSANSYSLVNNLRSVIIDNTEALRDVKKLIADSRSSNSDLLTTCPSTNSAVEVEKISETNQSEQQQQQEEYDDQGDDDTDKVSKKRRSKKRKFVLPPEYDKNDARWTLKHRESAPGLVELMPHTNVYVKSLALSNCKRLSKDCKSLARMLLVEIFTKSALSVCSLTGSRARAYDVEGATIRPGLDENARTVLLTYVEEYGREKEWITADTSSIQNSLRNKMQEFRFKYA